jgi:predicted XRE-type DNA-binding protein
MESKFLKKVEKTDSCWNWTGRLDIGGYGRFSRGNGHWTKAHRTSYEIYKGNIPNGLIIRHLCHNRKCVNPNHLETGTQKDNVKDMYLANRQPNRKGAKNSQSKITQQDADEIRQWREFGYTQQSIADVFGISQGNISAIVARKLW